MSTKTTKLIFIAGSILLILHIAFRKYQKNVTPHYFHEARTYTPLLDQLERAIHLKGDHERIDSLIVLIYPLIQDGLKTENQVHIRYLLLQAINYMNINSVKEARTVLHKCYKLINVADSELEQKAINELLAFHDRHNNAAELKVLLKEQLASSQKHKLRNYEYYIRRQQGYYEVSYGQLTEAVTHFREAKIIAEQLGDSSHIILSDIGICMHDPSYSADERISKLSAYAQRPELLNANTKWRLYAFLSDLYYFDAEDYANNYHFLKLQLQAIMELDPGITKNEMQAFTLSNLADAAYMVQSEGEAQEWLDDAFAMREHMNLNWLHELYDNYIVINHVSDQDKIKEKYVELADFYAHSIKEKNDMLSDLSANLLLAKQRLHEQKVGSELMKVKLQRTIMTMTIIILLLALGILGRLTYQSVTYARTHNRIKAVHSKLMGLGQTFIIGAAEFSFVKAMINRASFNMDARNPETIKVVDQIGQELYYYKSTWDEPLAPLKEELKLTQEFIDVIAPEGVYKGVHIQLDSDPTQKFSKQHLVPKYMMKTVVCMVLTSCYMTHTKRAIMHVSYNPNNIKIVCITDGDINKSALYNQYHRQLRSLLHHFKEKEIHINKTDEGTVITVDLPMII